MFRSLTEEIRLCLEVVSKGKKELRKRAAVAQHGRNRLVRDLPPKARGEGGNPPSPEAIRKVQGRRRIMKKQYQSVTKFDPLEKRADPKSKASLIHMKDGKPAEKDLPRSMIGNQRGIDRAEKLARKRGLDVRATRTS